jgi:hypothetical protein
MRVLIPGLLFGASLVLIGAIAYESLAPLDPVVVETPRPSLRHVPSIKPVAYAPPAIELFADLDARPLFTATRKPLQDPTQANGAAAPSSDFVLVGVIMGGSRAVALLRNKATSASTSAAVGDVVNGWRVAKIDATTVTLHANGSDFVVPLDSPANQPASPPLVAPPPPQPLTPVPAPPPQAAPPATKPPPQTAATPTPGKPALPAKPGGGTIAPEALKGAPIDPTTGQPTL